MTKPCLRPLDPLQEQQDSCAPNRETAAAPLPTTTRKEPATEIKHTNRTRLERNREHLSHLKQKRSPNQMESPADRPPNTQLHSVWRTKSVEEYQHLISTTRSLEGGISRSTLKLSRWRGTFLDPHLEASFQQLLAKQYAVRLKRILCACIAYMVVQVISTAVKTYAQRELICRCFLLANFVVGLMTLHRCPENKASERINELIIALFTIGCLLTGLVTKFEFEDIKKGCHSGDV